MGRNRNRPLSRHETALMSCTLERHAAMKAEITGIKAAYIRSCAVAAPTGTQCDGGIRTPVQERILAQQDHDPRLRMLEEITEAVEEGLARLTLEERAVVEMMHLSPQRKNCRQIAARINTVPRSVWRYRKTAFAKMGPCVLPVVFRYEYR